MSIHALKSKGKGSLNQIQLYVNQHIHDLENELRKAVPALIGDQIQWVSPLATKRHEEYRDHDFLDVLGLKHHQASLDTFWPKGGPQWDALARTNSGKVILVEAKANIPELKSSCQAKATPIN